MHAGRDVRALGSAEGGGVAGSEASLAAGDPSLPSGRRHVRRLPPASSETGRRRRSHRCELDTLRSCSATARATASVSDRLERSQEANPFLQSDTLRA